MQHEYTPTIEEVLATLRSNYQVVMSEWQEDDTDRLVEYGAHFDSVIARIEAAAEQRGAAKALRDAAEDLFYDGDTDRPMPGYSDLLDRADQMERDE